MAVRPEPAAPRQWERFVALGDSFTEGLVDPDPEETDGYVGWADRVAAGLAERNALEGRPFGYANLAIRGRLLRQILDTQLEPALALTPDLVSLSAGGNDVLRPKVDLLEVMETLESAVEQIRETGADVILVTAPNVSWAHLVGRMHPRMVEYTAHLWGIGQRTGSFVVDIFTLRSLQDPRMWGEDRIHFSAEGHARVAAQALWTLGMPFVHRDWAEPLAPMEPLTRFASLQADRDWVAAHLTPWIRRRLRGTSSGDGRQPKRPDVLPIEGSHPIPLEPPDPVIVEEPQPLEPPQGLEPPGH